MELKRLPQEFTICKLKSLSDVNYEAAFCFVGKTDEEISLVCETADVPVETVERDDGWRGFRVQGVLDFSLVGVLARISSILAAAGVGIFAVSTYNTDYVFVKEENFEKAMLVLSAEGYAVV